MPILDIEIVQADGAAPPAASLTQALADAAGLVLGSTPGPHLGPPARAAGIPLRREPCAFGGVLVT